MDSIIYRPSAATKAPLVDYLHEREKEILQLSPPDPNKEIDFWFQRERSFFTLLLSQYVIEDERFNLREYEAIQRRVLSGKSETRGRKPKYAPGWSDITYRHALRHHFIDELIAQALGAEFNEPIPSPPVNRPKFSPEVIDTLMKFETLSDYTLPRKAYVIFTREDRAIIWFALHNQLKDKYWCEDGLYCVKFEEYAHLRLEPSNKPKIQNILIQNAINKEGLPPECIVQKVRSAEC